MKAQDCVLFLGNFGYGTTIERNRSLFCFSIFITLLTLFCVSGQGIKTINTEMFEIPMNDQKFYMLKDCRKMDSGNFDCRCVRLGSECVQGNTTSCNGCSCLDGSTRTFYIKKRYGAVCLSINNLFKAAGFGERFLIYSPNFKVCARAITSIHHSQDCTFQDLRDQWLWAPGKLLMNVKTSRCLEARKTRTDNYLSMSVRQCNSSNIGQTWRCNSRLFLGVSFPNGTLNITHATRYWAGDPALKARDIKHQVSKGNIWTVFPTENQSVCSTIYREGRFYLNDGDTRISLIDLVPLCPAGICAEKLLTSKNVKTELLSNCTILWEETFSQVSRPFTVEKRHDGLFFMWKSNPYTRLKGRTLNLTIECIKNNSKFEEYLFPLQIKDINLQRTQENRQLINQKADVPTLDVDKGCQGNYCSKEIAAPSTLDKQEAVCVIQWSESSLSRLDNSSVGIENVTHLLSLKKIEGSFMLEWNLTDAQLLANTTFNLTILCYNAQQENITLAETSFLIFQTRYGFIFSSEKSDSSDRTLYFATIMPVIFVLLVIIVVIIFWTFRWKQKKRIKESTSRSNLHSHVETQYSNGSVNSDLDGVESKSEDNPVYEQCTATTHPTVTIARNKLYESTNSNSGRPESNIYEKPLLNVKIHQDQFEDVAPARHSPRTKPHHLPEKPSPKPVPRTNLKPNPKTPLKPSPRPGKKPILTPHYKVPKVVEEQEFYDQPLGFIPSTRNGEEMKKEEIGLQELDDKRVVSVYEKPLPASPKDSGIYDYATREDLNPVLCPSEKPFELNSGGEGNEKGGSEDGTLYDSPYYDVLEH